MPGVVWNVTFHGPKQNAGSQMSDQLQNVLLFGFVLSIIMVFAIFYVTTPSLGVSPEADPTACPEEREPEPEPQSASWWEYVIGVESLWRLLKEFQFFFGAKQ